MRRSHPGAAPQASHQEKNSLHAGMRHTPERRGARRVHHSAHNTRI
jgi:hypothetical protein